MPRPLLTSLFVAFLLTFTLAANAQSDLKLPQKSPKASCSLTIGLTEIEIHYSSPGLNDRTIWGGIVPYGEVWRAGANEATTIEFSNDVKVEGQDLAAGTYALFMIPREEGDWTVIFSKNVKQWGSFRYNEEEDALRVDVTPEEAPHQEWLLYGFDNLAGTAGTAFLHWEKKKVPFKIETAE